MSVDLYRSAEIADQFADGVRTLVAQGKPVAITEFGCATYRGARRPSARAAWRSSSTTETGRPVRLNGEYDRDEAGQAGVSARTAGGLRRRRRRQRLRVPLRLYDHPHRPDGDPRDDLDLASYGIVKVFDDRHGDTYPDMPWEPKAAFAALAEYYRGRPVRTG